MAVRTDEEAEARKAAKHERERQRELKLQRDNAVKALLASPDGRVYLWWVLEISKAIGSPYRGNASATDFACGEQNVGLQLMAHMIESDPVAFTDMMKENEIARSNRALADAARANAEPDSEPDSDTGPERYT